MTQRKIKFRAWHKELKIMAKVFMLDLGNGDVSLDDCVVPPIMDDDIPGNSWAKAKDVILMQFTGLYDKNNIPIFEGDIVKSETDDEDSAAGAVITTIAEVCYGQHPKAHRECDYLASFTLYSTDFYDEHAIFYGRRWTHEVIGNIHENANLLVKKKNENV